MENVLPATLARTPPHAALASSMPKTSMKRRCPPGSTWSATMRTNRSSWAHWWWVASSSDLSLEDSVGTTLEGRRVSMLLHLALGYLQGQQEYADLWSSPISPATCGKPVQKCTSEDHSYKIIIRAVWSINNLHHVCCLPPGLQFLPSSVLVVSHVHFDRVLLPR